MKYKFFKEVVTKLTRYNRFVLYDNEKSPLSALTGHQCSPTNPSGWTNFDRAFSTYLSDPVKYAGVGYCLDAEDGIVCIDIDKCISADGDLNEVAKDILNHISSPTYVEVSKSGTGLHIFVEGKKNTSRCKNDNIEVYSGKRFIALTANPLASYQLVDVSFNQNLVDYVCDKYLGTEGASGTLSEDENKLGVATEISDDILLEKAMKAKNGKKFKALWEGNSDGYKSPSEADLALMNDLAFWTGKNRNQMVRLFMQSGRTRDKTQRTDYISDLANKAISSCTNVYTPRKEKNKINNINELTWNRSPFTDAEIDEVIMQINPCFNHKYSGFDDLSISLIYGAITKNKLRYVLESSKWAYFDGSKFVFDAKNSVLVQGALKHISYRLQQYLDSNKAKYDINDPRFRQLNKTIQKITSSSFRSKLEADLRERNPISLTCFDEERNLFNCKNGILKLDTLELLPHDPKYLLTKECGVEYNPDAKCPLFEQTVDQIMEHDADKVKFLRMALGASLLGFNSEEKMYIFYGATTRNGKSTITEAVHSVFGDYGCNIEPETLAASKKDSRAASGDIARLRGMRYVQSAEPNKNMIFDVALVKRITGNDTITARNLFENESEFMPMFITYMNTNHLPKVMDTTLFASDRIRVIPFNHHFTEDERDSQLKQKLQSEYSGIFNWLLEGMKDFLQNPKYYPEAIKKATIDYESESDKSEQFISECFVADDKSNLSGKYVYSLYRVWCEDNGLRVEGKATLFKELRKKGYLHESGTVKSKTERNVLVGFTEADHDFEPAKDTPFNP